MATRLRSRVANIRRQRRMTSQQWVLQNLPQPNARTVMSRGQFLIGGFLLVCLVAALIWRPTLTLLAINLSCLLFYLIFTNYKLLVQLTGLLRSAPPAPPLAMPTGNSWPTYTVMVPLYREPLAATGLVRHLARLDYPIDRLQILLLLEEDDPETRAALAESSLPAHFTLLTVPDCLPRTKPKACNFGLQHATGEYLVIFDAEDRPELDQLKRAAIGFVQAGPEVACLQAALQYYNPNHNLLTRWFAVEYLAWFDLTLPGLAALDAPVPLGGTSNHFQTEFLRRLGGWDPFNVTEDCDLGIRFYLSGRRVSLLN